MVKKNAIVFFVFASIVFSANLGCDASSESDYFSRNWQPLLDFMIEEDGTELRNLKHSPVIKRPQRNNKYLGFVSNDFSENEYLKNDRGWEEAFSQSWDDCNKYSRRYSGSFEGNQSLPPERISSSLSPVFSRQPTSFLPPPIQPTPLLNSNDNYGTTRVPPNYHQQNHQDKAPALNIALQDLRNKAQQERYNYPKTLSTLEEVEAFAFMPYKLYNDKHVDNILVPVFQFSNFVFVDIPGEPYCRDAGRVVKTALDIFVAGHPEIATPAAFNGRTSFSLDFDLPYDGMYWHTLRKLFIWNIYYNGNIGLSLDDQSVKRFLANEYPQIYLCFLKGLSIDDMMGIFP